MSVKNFVQCGLVTPVAANTTELVLMAPTASYQYPPLDGGTLVIADSVARPSFYEIISYTHRIENVLYGVVRAKEGTTARTWSGVTWIYQALTAQDYVDALALKAALASPAFTGIPTAPTAALGTNTNQIATMAAVKAAIDNLVGGAPGALDALNEFAAALGNDPNFATTMTNALAGKEPSIAPSTSAQMWLGNKTWASVLSQVQGTLLTGLGAGANTPIVSTDTLIGALAKIQNQLNNKAAFTDSRLSDAREWTATEVSQAEAQAGTATIPRKWSALRVWQAVLASSLTGLNLTVGTAVAASDTVLVAIGKLQKQITDAASNLAGSVRATVLTGYVSGSNAVLASTDTVLAAFGKVQAQITGLATSKLDASANAVSASKLQNARTIALSGDVTGSANFDGSGDVSINAQVADNSHTHSLSNLGLGTAATKNVGTSSGDVVEVGAFGLGYAQKVADFAQRIDSGFYLSSGTSDGRPTGMVADGGWMLNLNWAFNGVGNRYNCAFYGNVQNNFIGFRRINQLGEPQAPVELYHTGNIGNANAGTATKLQTARTIALSGNVTGSGSFDGSGNLTIAATVADNSHNHIIGNVDGLQAALDAKAPLASPALTGTPTAPTAAVGNSSTQVATTAFVNAEIANDAPSKTGTGASGSWGISVTGNAATATKLATAQTLSLAGDVTGSATFDGSANASITATVANDSHSHSTSTITGLGTAATKNITISTAAPSGGADGDLWIQY